MSRFLFNHGKAVDGIRNLLRYGINAEHCMASSRKNTPLVMPYAFGNSIHYTSALMPYQACGLDRKKTVVKRSFFLVRVKGLGLVASPR